MAQKEKPRARAEREGRNPGLPSQPWETAEPPACDPKVKDVPRQGFRSPAFKAAAGKWLEFIGAEVLGRETD